MAGVVHDPAGAKISKITHKRRVDPHPLYSMYMLLSSVFLHHRIAMLSYYIISRSHLPTHQSIKILLEALGQRTTNGMQVSSRVLVFSPLEFSPLLQYYKHHESSARITISQQHNNEVQLGDRTCILKLSFPNRALNSSINFSASTSTTQMSCRMLRPDPQKRNRLILRSCRLATCTRFAFDCNLCMNLFQDGMAYYEIGQGKVRMYSRGVQSRRMLIKSTYFSMTSAENASPSPHGQMPP